VIGRDEIIKSDVTVCYPKKRPQEFWARGGSLLSE